MKVHQIIISNYRAFYNEQGEERTKYTIDLKDGKNLLIYGENGSGKSSFYKGLKDLFRSSVDPGFRLIENIFAKDLELDEQPFIEVTFKENNQPDKTYRFSADPHRNLVNDDILRSVARARSFMTYRDLLRIHFVSDPEVNLFDFLFENDGLLAGVPNPAPSSPETNLKLSDLLEVVKANPDNVNIKDITSGINQTLGDLNTILNHLLRYFDESLSVTFSQLTEESIRTRIPIVKLKVIYFGADLSSSAEQYHHFLNEARLSALAICIFLAAHLSVPSPQVKILFLDDIFTGLDMSNRMPLLNILTDPVIKGTTETFKDHQIFLTTYDRQWYELAKNELGSGKWYFHEMYIDRHTKGFEHPAWIPGESDFEKAQYYFRMKQYAACANYQRKICERLIRKFLPEYKKYDALPSGDIKPVEKLSTLIDRFEAYLTENEIDFAPYQKLRICLRAYMNPFSHDDGESPAYRRELELGFSLIEKLNKLDNKERIKQGEIIQTTQTHSNTGIAYLYEFEVQTSVRAIITESDKKISKLFIRPMKMTTLNDNKEKQLGYEPESLEKGMKSVCAFLKITEELDPYNEFKWKNGDNYEPLSTLLNI